MEWLWDNRVSLAASDTYALKCMPPIQDSEFSSTNDGGMMHHELLALPCMAADELWKLDELALACRDDGQHSCLLVSSPLHVRGGVSTPANALAIR